MYFEAPDALISWMQIRASTRKAVYLAASGCQITQRQSVIDDPLEGPLAVVQAFVDWQRRAADGSVRLSFNAGLAVFDFVQAA
jgi:hypothetical protein